MGIITADLPMTIQELVKLAPLRATLNSEHASAGAKLVALRAYGPMIKAMSIEHGLPAEGGKYNTVVVDGRIYLQWWSDEFMASFQREV